mgnify:FL=1
MTKKKRNEDDFLARSVSRRSLLKGGAGSVAGLAAGSLLAGCGGSGSAVAQAPDGREDEAGQRAPQAALKNPFLHGVASGDPLQDRVILWTRVTPAAHGRVLVHWRIARDPLMLEVLHSGKTETDASRDYTVHVDAAGLAADAVYYYQFSAFGHVSPIGRTKTTASRHLERLRLAVCSCSNYPHGFFNVYAALARRTDLDAVLHLGDYIYEYGNEGYGGDTGAAINREVVPEHDIVTLEDYRSRYAHYRRDPDLQAAHQQHPFIVVWDDHESANNAWQHGAENHDEATQGHWIYRRAAALQAFREWLPIRQDHDDPARIYRSFRFGNLVDLFMLDTRLYGRDLQAGTLPLDAATINDPNRQILGPTQENWLEYQLYESRARWKILGQQVMFGQLNLAPALPIVSELVGGLPVAGGLVRELPLLGSVLASDGLLLNVDQWDGYPAARRRVMDMLSRIDNPIVLTGDIHTSWAMELTPEPANPLRYSPVTGRGSIGVEFVTPSVTSPGLPELAPVAEAIRLLNPHIKYVDLQRHGYVLLDITHDRTQAEWWYVPGITARSHEEYLGRAYVVEAGSNTLTPAGGVTRERPQIAALAPTPAPA